MPPIFKINLEEKLKNSTKISIELGSGKKNNPNHINIDIIDNAGTDIVCNLEEGLPFFPDNSIDEIHSRHFLEHISNFDLLLKEIVRILKKDGICYISVPHFSNPYFYSDPTHKRFFGLYTFYYYTKQKHQLKRKVPNFYTETNIHIIEIRYVFYSPFKYRNYIKKTIGKIINSSCYLKELYEENFCHIFPCYGIELSFKKSST